MSGLIEDMICNGATKEEIKVAIKNVKRVKQALDVLGSFQEKYQKHQTNNSNRITYRNHCYYYDPNAQFIDYINDITFKYKEEAKNVINAMATLIDKYGYVTVLDLYDLSGIISPNPCKDNKYGWRNKYDILSAIIIKSGKKDNKYHINFSNPVYLD